jgi:hypothetical protein
VELGSLQSRLIMVGGGGKGGRGEFSGAALSLSETHYIFYIVDYTAK